MHFAPTDYGTFHLPSCGSGSVSIYGWIYVPAGNSGNDGMKLGLGAHLPITYSDVWKRWVIAVDWWDPYLYLWGAEEGWIWVCITYSASAISAYWRRDGQWDMASGDVGSASWSYNDAQTSGYFGDYDSGSLTWVGDVQYWGTIATALTEAQCLAQSQSSTQLVAGVSFWPLTSNSGTATVGVYNVTLAGTTVSDLSAPARTFGPPDTSLSTEVARLPGDRLDVGQVSSCVATGSNDFTISFWIKLQAGSANAYTLGIKDGASEWTENGAFIVAQHEEGSDEYGVFIDSHVDGSGAEYGGFWAAPGNALALGWVFLACTFTRGATNTTVRIYLGFGAGCTMSLLATQVVPHQYPAGWITQVGVASERFWLQHLRFHDGAKTLTEIQVLSAAKAPDTSAWGHYPLYSANPADVSGNNRNIDILREWWPGVAGVVL